MSDNTDTAALLSFADRLADTAGAAILPHFRADLDVDNKLADGFDPVTVGDRAGEAAMRALIEAEAPDHGILGEEHGPARLDAEHVWVLDPIDGTRAFICGLPTWGTLIGLRRNGRPVLGVMDQPFVRERFYGDGARAWRTYDGRETALRTRACDRLEDAIFCTTHPRLFTGAQCPVYEEIEATVRTARFGTDCYGYCMLAAGHVDLVIEPGLQAYDIVALVPIVEGAGGVVTTWTGGAPDDGGDIIASGDPRLHDAMLTRLARIGT
ncbi:histidinol-phosphatase [Stappia sp.]|uniref:histidinol-phosphatase n=1 Tax=Stappia sp. TaxID=1870903 RepID=UPI0032D97F09